MTLRIGKRGLTPISFNLTSGSFTALETQRCTVSRLKTSQVLNGIVVKRAAEPIRDFISTQIITKYAAII